MGYSEQKIIGYGLILNFLLFIYDSLPNRFAITDTFIITFVNISKTVKNNKLTYSEDYFFCLK